MITLDPNLQVRRSWFSGARRWLLLALLLVAVLVLLWPRKPAQDGRYITEEAVLGPLTVSISATGTLAPTRAVDVGSELSGTLEAVLVDDNDRVRKGQLLARLDTAKLADAVTRSRAAVTAAEASVAQAQATVLETRASLERLQQVAALSGGQVPSRAELDAGRAAAARAQANLDSARAAVTQARAVLQTDTTNIAKAVIRSPIDGVVLARKVEPGQTVAAAMTTPVLFQLAEDLTHMQLDVRVDEADVGSVALGQPASFSVAAWPGRSFPAKIERIGIGSTLIDNVVTYKTVLSVANDDLALRPGMTATARIITADKAQALLVPAAALRFSPPAAEAEGSSLIDRLLPRMPRRSKKAQFESAPGTQARVFVLQDGQPRAVSVQLGLSNGRQTEIVSGELKSGMQVITDHLTGARP